MQATCYLPAQGLAMRPMKLIAFSLLFFVSLSQAQIVPHLVPCYPQLRPTIYTDDVTTIFRARALNTKKWAELMITFQKQNLPRSLKRTVVHFFADFVILSDFIEYYPDIVPKHPHEWEKSIWPSNIKALPWWARDIPMSQDRELIVNGLVANLCQSTFHMIRALGRSRLPQDARVELMRAILGRIEPAMREHLELRKNLKEAFQAATRHHMLDARRHLRRIGGTSLGLMALVAMISPLLGPMNLLEFDPTGSFSVLALEVMLLAPPIYISHMENRRAEIRSVCNEFWEN
jgi:hypothetical protein